MKMETLIEHRDIICANTGQAKGSIDIISWDNSAYTSKKESRPWWEISSWLLLMFVVLMLGNYEIGYIQGNQQGYSAGQIAELHKELHK